MKKHVIALGRQFGSGGREIGRKLSESLGFAYYDRELLKLAAERAEVGEELFADKDEKGRQPLAVQGLLSGRPQGQAGAVGGGCALSDAERDHPGTGWRRRTASSWAAARILC